MSALKILVAPLDWGLGHATRCIPIVNELVSNGCAVTIAAEGKVLQVLREEFPRLSFLPLKGYRIFYHKGRNGFAFKMARQIPRIIAVISYEQAWLREVMEEHQFDMVISDNRYGLYTKRAYSVFITHQLNIKTGIGTWADRWLRRINYWYIKRFDECWVPDFEEVPNLAGVLSHPLVAPPNVRYLGPLSRLVKINTEKKYDLVFILSGPEPRRSLWERALLKELHRYRGRVLLIRGLPEDAPPVAVAAPVEVINFAASEALNAVIQQAEWVICRSGYTSIMDLVQLRQKAILVPTPGQAEQEYLAQWLYSNNIFYTCTEDAFSLPDTICRAAEFPFDFSGFSLPFSGYKNTIGELVKLKLQ